MQEMKGLHSILGFGRKGPALHGKGRDFALNVFVVLFITLVFVLTAYPFWYVLVYSLTKPSALSMGFQIFPKVFTFMAYESLFSSPRILNAFFISVARSTTGPILSGIVSMLVAYGLSIRDLPGRRFFNWFFVLTMYFGAGLIPTYLLYRNLGLNNSFWIYIVPSIMNVYGMILMRTYIESLPAALKESAFIDGANDFTVFHRVIAPLCLPVIAAVSLFACVAQWNSYTDTVIYNSMNEKLHTLQYVLVQLVSSLSSQSDLAMEMMMKNRNSVRLTPMIVRMAMTVIVTVPIAMVYPILQRYFIKGLLVGSVKG